MELILQLAIFSTIAAIAASGLNYVAGFTGIMSISQASFYGVGAYGTALMLTKLEFGFLPSLLLAVIITAAVAALASIPILRLKEDSLMLVSVGFSLIAFSILLNWTSLTNGALGVKAIPNPSILGYEFSSLLSFLILAIIALILVLLFLNKIVKSPYGTVIKGIRENEEVMKNTGYNTSLYKHSVFIIGSAIAGIAGGLFATFIQFIEPPSFNVMPSVFMLIMVILGGLGSISGAVLGATIITVVPELLRFVGLPSSIFAESQQVLHGLILFGLMYWRPQGLLGRYKI